MALCCVLQPLLLLHRPQPPPLLTSHNALHPSKPFHHPCASHSRPLPVGMPLSRCIGPNRTSPSNVETGSSGASSGNESALTHSKRAAIEVGRGFSLVAFYSDHHGVPVPADKYRATRLLLEGDPSLLNLLVIRPSPMVSFEELCLVYDERYIQKISDGDLSEKEKRNFSFSWYPELVKRSYASVGGTVAAMHIVMLGLRRAAANIAGGTQHNITGYGEGSCVFNDVAVAAFEALQTYPDSCNRKRPILVIDLDVHQDNGIAKLFEADDRVVTFSMHGVNKLPWHTKMKSSYSVDVLDSTGDEYYLAVLSNLLRQLLNSYNPSLVFFQAGVDALREDISGSLSVTRQGLLHRNNIVYTGCLTRKLPLVITMGGGCSTASEASIEAYADVFRSAALRYGTNYTFFQ